jgi:hypothetical protein
MSAKVAVLVVERELATAERILNFYRVWGWVILVADDEMPDVPEHQLLRVVGRNPALYPGLITVGPGGTIPDMQYLPRVLPCDPDHPAHRLAEEGECLKSDE